jgi:hypothetical protein
MWRSVVGESRLCRKQAGKCAARKAAANRGGRGGRRPCDTALCRRSRVVALAVLVMALRSWSKLYALIVKLVDLIA